MNASVLNSKTLLQMALRAEVWCFILLTIFCWLRDWATPGGIILRHPEASLACWVATLVCSILLWRLRRGLAIAGLLAFFFWGVWALYPRL